MRTIKAFIACFLMFLVGFSTTGIAVGQEPEYFSYLPLIMSPPGPCSAAPTLISPTNGSNPQTLIPTFRWENGDTTGVTEVNFLLTLHVDDFPNDWVYWSSTNNRNFEEQQYNTKNLDPNTTYYWQTWMRCGEVESPHTAVWSFTTGADGTILAGPNLLFPADAAEISHEMLPLTLLWSPVTGAIKYKVVIYRWADGMWYWDYSAFVTEPQYQIPYTMTQYTDYKWTVFPINDYAIGSSSSRTFETTW
jgi:hypothetical protein